MRYYIENRILKVEIDSLGAEVKSILRKDNYREYMWYGNPKFWGRTSPVLFPFVGSLKNKQYSWKGQKYPMGQHGFARDMEFSLQSQKDGEIWFLLESSGETLKKYPFDFRLLIGYALKEDEVQVMWKVENSGREKMYFSIGAHPAFLCPIHGEASKAGYSLYFEGAGEIHHYGNASAGGLAVDENLTLELKESRARISEDFFDRTTFFVEGQTNLIGIEDPDGNRIVDVKYQAPIAGIWSPEKKNAPFLCIEPWYGRCDAENFEGELNERAFTNVLEKGEEFKGGYSMKFYRV